LVRFTRVLAILFFFSSDSAGTDRIWYLNARGTSNQYAIVRFAGKHASPPRPVVAPKARGEHVAWPSAVNHNGKVVLFASEFRDGGWWQIVRWESSDGIAFVRVGPVMTANASERYGIGPAQVYYDPTLEPSFGMFFLIRGMDGPGKQVAFASSADGLIWTRQAVVLTSSAAEEDSGLSVSYACLASDGRWALFYQAYPRQDSGVAMLARSDSPDRVFEQKKVLLRPSWSSAEIVSAHESTDFALVTDAASIEVGVPHVLVSASGWIGELVTVTEVFDERVWFDRRLVNSYPGGALVSILSAKVDISYAQELEAGWKGIATAYGPIPAQFSEYTVSVVSANGLEDGWSVAPHGVAFLPSFAEGYLSSENPSPLASSARCKD
jgi:hypothetical protein